MKTQIKILLTASVVLFCYVTGITQNTITLRTNASNSSSAIVSTLNTNYNYGTTDDFAAIAWTYVGNSFVMRSFLKFDLSMISPESTIQSAKLSLYSNPNSSNSQLHSSLSGSNACYLKRVTSSWSPSTISWSNQPTSSSVNQVALSQSSSMTQNYIDIDITNLIQDIINSGTNEGIVIQLQTEQLYRSMVFASNIHPDTALRPKITISFRAPASANTNISTSTLTYSPNPFQNEIVVSDAQGLLNSEDLSVIDMLGREVSVDKSGNEHQIFINTTKLSNGVYFLRYAAKGKKVQYFKLVKNS